MLVLEKAAIWFRPIPRTISSNSGHSRCWPRELEC